MAKSRESRAAGWRAKLVAGARHVLEKTLLWGERLPFGVRSVLGVLAMVAGLLGFLVGDGLVDNRFDECTGEHERRHACDGAGQQPARDYSFFHV